MISINRAAFASTAQWDLIIRGMRNPMNSWSKSDSCYTGSMFEFGDKDKALAKKLISAGDEHAKFLRMIPVHMEITAPLSWWKQFDTYDFVTKNSCSTMHKLMDKPFEFSDFSIERSSENALSPYIGMLNDLRDKYLETGDKYYWKKAEEVLLQSYEQTRMVYTDYAVLFRICAQRAGHKKDEWDELITWILDTAPFFEDLCFDKLCEISEGFKRGYGGRK